MDVQTIIKKREGGKLSDETVAGLVDAYTRGAVPDYQMSAFLMAAFLKGLDEDETTALTRAMLYSGDVIRWPEKSGPHIDKHSTGGVGDKISLVLAPLAAVCGVAVPMISGRGLGHSGGTLDKLEAIPGFRTGLEISVFKRQVDSIGVAMIGQTEEIAPADRKLYALRDVTGTVEYAPFITASIMSKKLAEGLDGLVMDVKCGGGAFMTSLEKARELTEMLVETGDRFGCRTVARLTRMDAPLGWAVGNWPEVREAVRCLQGESIPDVTELSVLLAAEMIVLAGIDDTLDDAVARARNRLESGDAYEKFVELVLAQGGDPWTLDSDSPHNTNVIQVDYTGRNAGYVSAIKAREVGLIGVKLGAGRQTMTDSVDPGAGLVLHTRFGDSLEPGQSLATLYSNKVVDVDDISRRLNEAIHVSSAAPDVNPLFIARHDRDGWSNEGENIHP